MKEGMTRKQSAMLQGIAILMMIYHHVFATPEIYGLEYVSVLQFGGINVERYLAWFCKMTSGLYLFVSGYGMYYVLKKHAEKVSAGESFAGYLLGCYRQVLTRLGRFYVQYWYALIVSMGLVFGLDPAAPAFSLKEFLLNMSGLSCSYNGTWWYVLQYVKMMLLLPFLSALFHKFSEPAQEKRKRFFYAAAFLIILLCLLVGLLWVPGLLEIMFKAGNGLRISFALVFVVGYLMARFSVYQKIAAMKIFQTGASGKKNLFAGVAALAFSVAARVLLSDGPSYAKLDFLIVPVFIFGVLTLLEKLPRLSAVLGFFGGLSTYMWLTHIFFWKEAFQPLVMLTGVSTGIFLTLVALSTGAAMLLKAGEDLAKRVRRGRKAELLE